MDGSIKREAYYDRNLDIEAYRLFGVFQSFPAHFHNYYVVGIVENGERKMFVKNKEYNVKKGDLIMFNPRESHGCVSLSDKPFGYTAFNINKNVFVNHAEFLDKSKYVPRFISNIGNGGSVYDCLKNLYLCIKENRAVNEKNLLSVFL